MHKKLARNQSGFASRLLLPLSISILMIIGLAGFSLWAYSSALDASDIETVQIDQAIYESGAVLQEGLEEDFANEQREPNTQYVSPSESGSVTITYPKSWSAYVQEDRGNEPINGYFHPEFVPSERAEEAFGLRVFMDTSSIPQIRESFSPSIGEGLLVESQITVSGVTGVRFDGLLARDIVGSMVIFPVRDKTLRIWTESITYRSEFNDPVIKNLSFIP